jgi:4-amino-4-deoxy-L-arabinose transferase-like glycosyltransferase
MKGDGSAAPSLPARHAATGLPSALAWVTATHLRALAILSLVALACFLPGLGGIAPVDRDEPRFAQATRQMLETGDFIDIRFQDEPRYQKPVGIYWLQAAMVTATGHGRTPRSGLPPRLGARRPCRRPPHLLGRPAPLRPDGRMIAGLAMATMPLLVAEAHLAKTDAVLLATVVLAEGVLARAYVADAGARLRPGTALLFWAGLGIGILVKGPIVVMVVGLTVLALVALDRRGAWLLRLRPALGVPLTLLIVLPWLVAILSRTGTGFLSASVGGDLLGKVASGQESHGAPPGYHTLLFFVLFLPAVLLLPSALGAIWARRREAAVKFCLAWLLPAWLVFELVATKLPHYTLPLYPAAALLVGGVAADGRLVTGRWWTRGAALLPALLVTGFALGSLALLAHLEGSVSPPATLLAILAAFLALAAAQRTWTDRPLAGAGLLAGAAVAAYAGVLGFILPAAETLRLSPRLAMAIAADAGCPEPRLVATGYDEPSLVFATGTGIRFTDPRAAADFLGRDGCRLALVEAQREDAFLARAARRGTAVEKRAILEGMSLGRFAPLVVGLYRAVPPGK